MVANRFFCRRSSITLAAFLTASFTLIPSPSPEISSRIRRATLRPFAVILRSGDKRLELDENETIERRSFSRRDEITSLIARLTVSILLPPTSRTVTKSTGGLRRDDGNGGDLIFISTEYVSLPLPTATTAASEDSLTSTESVSRFFFDVNGDGVLTKKPLKPPLFFFFFV
ncbi:hypothetical protein Rs2_45467 [Raphanus sativus]|nr:hypothetical protein Rs2_45467 [Raphanus sativus]